MKIFTFISGILLSSSFSCFAADFSFIAADNKTTTKICIAAATDNMQVMVAKLQSLSRRGTALSYRSFVNTIQCNNQYIGHFAKTFQAQQSADYLARYTNASNKKRQANISIRDIAKLNNNQHIVMVRGQ